MYACGVTLCVYVFVVCILCLCARACMRACVSNCKPLMHVAQGGDHIEQATTLTATPTRYPAHDGTRLAPSTITMPTFHMPGSVLATTQGPSVVGGGAPNALSRGGASSLQGVAGHVGGDSPAMELAILPPFGSLSLSQGTGRFRAHLTAAPLRGGMYGAVRGWVVGRDGGGGGC